MRTKKKYSISKSYKEGTKKNFSLPKPLIDFSNIDTSFADKMIHFDDERNGRLNLVKVKDVEIPKSLLKTKTKKTKTKKTSTK